LISLFLFDTKKIDSLFCDIELVGTNLSVLLSIYNHKLNFILELEARECEGETVGHLFTFPRGILSYLFFN